ncbi:MAG: class I SAM-dependent methyltransferase [Phycisphaerae bacterium]|nr:class I SAM-dependent methyltransferase [Phycisphaerae bacterium]NIX26808.1 methyltransferase domain-containing protein [Phycisphaerae bacterium]
MGSYSVFDKVARYYDLLYENREDDLSMWLELTADLDGDLLEVGCGTGRVMLSLVQHDRRITGIDISELALQAARAKLEAGGFANIASLHLADMRIFDLSQKNFAFAFIPINTFMHCQTLADQQATLKHVYNHLKPNGQLVVDLYHPDPQTLLEADGRLLLENQIIDDLTGHTIQWFIVRRLRLDQQIQEVTFILDEITDAGTIRRDTFSFSLRYLHRFEMELLLSNAGFELEDVLGDYDLSSFQDESPRMIFKAKKVSAI